MVHRRCRFGPLGAGNSKALARGGEAMRLVVTAEENKTRQSQAFPADPLYPNQWSLPKIGWDQVFGALTPTGSAIVAVLDTGVDAQHPDLAGNVIPGTSILDGSAGTTDPSGHGTWVAGIAAAQTNTLEGIAGVAYAGVPIDKLLGDRARDARGSAGRERASFSTWACPRTGSAHGGFDARR